jgi:multiple sugar transport system permease protein
MTNRASERSRSPVSSSAAKISRGEQDGVLVTIARWLSSHSVLNTILLTIGAIIFVMPFVWMISTSFKPRNETISIPPRILPENWTLENYGETLRRLPIVRLYMNTFYVAITRTIIGVYTSTLLGYIFAKFRFWGRETIFLFLLGTMIIPFSVYMVALYVMWVQLGLADKLLGLIVGGFFNVYGIFLARQFMHNVPTELIEAARIDGAGELKIFHSIVMRLSVPVMATLAAFEFMGQMNAFLWPLIVISTEKKYTLALGLSTFTRDMGTDYGLTMAGAVFTTIPMLIIFVTMQRQIIQGISFSGIK